ncbi:MAG: hypothetical protein IJC71_00380 [Clostridia bacterium]|nr:hypothetical protein [Clostridia bacterium]
MKYLVFGETIWDVYPDKSVIGGASFNFAAHTSLLGGEVHLVTGLGHDKLGDDAAVCMERYGIKTDFVCWNDKPTGQCLVTLGENGVPQYNVLTDVAYDNVTVDEEMLGKIRALQPDVFYFNTLAQRCPVSRKAILTLLNEVSFAHIFCDVNIRTGCWDRESLKLCMERATIAKVSEEEAHFFADCGLIDGTVPFAEAIAKAFPTLHMLVYTMGAKGSIVYDFKAGTETFSGEPEQVKVVSTVGAGDCYSAAFIHTYLTGSDIPEAIRAASARSNVVVAHTEAIPHVFLA